MMLFKMLETSTSQNVSSPFSLLLGCLGSNPWSDEFLSYNRRMGSSDVQAMFSKMNVPSKNEHLQSNGPAFCSHWTSSNASVHNFIHTTLYRSKTEYCGLWWFGENLELVNHNLRCWPQHHSSFPCGLLKNSNSRWNDIPGDRNLHFRHW